MTTIACDGNTMAADTMGVDAYGLIEPALEKIWSNQHVFVGGAGDFGQIQRWMRTLSTHTTASDIVHEGYTFFQKGDNDPNILVFDRDSKNLWRQSSGVFLKVNYEKFAIGSGRDYALAAMYCGKTAEEAVAVAMHFDSGTGGEIVCLEA